MAGRTNSSNFPTRNAFQPVHGGGTDPFGTPWFDGFVTKFDRTGSTVIYYGANDGWLRAADSVTGKELWAYVAPEFYATLPRLRQNSPLISYPSIVSSVSLPKSYYFDGPIGVYQNASSSNVWIYPTMRRGGRMIYALDVTTPTAPTLKWTRGCPHLTNDTGCDTGFAPIGQTWSTPNVAGLKIGGTAAETPTPVVGFGGGYDNCEDGSPNDPCTGAKGSIVYILNADTGAVVNSFTTAGPFTTGPSNPAPGRVVADVAYVDFDNDGIPDFAFVVDTRGNIYRIGFGMSRTAPLPAGSWTWTRVACTAGPSSDCNSPTRSNRKFLYAPALLPARDSATGKNYVYLALGSGDREEPLITQYPYADPVLNRFYAYIDDVSATPNPPTNIDDVSTGTINNYTTSPACDDTAALVIPGSGKSGWFMDLNQYGRGEQTVTSAVIVGGFVAFSTNRACDGITPCNGAAANPNVCAPLGEARGYAVNLFNASGVIGAQPNICGGGRSEYFVGGGLPPSPVSADVDVDGQVVSILIGVVSLNGDASSGVQSQKGFTLPQQARKRVYWRQEGNN